MILTKVWFDHSLKLREKQLKNKNKKKNGLTG